MSIPLSDFIASVAGAAPSPEIADSVAIQSVWDFVMKGGVVMIPLAICSLVALAVFFERLIVLRRSRIIPPSFLPGLRKELGRGADRIAAAVRYCRADGSPVASVFAAGIRHLDGPTDVLERRIEDAGQREVLRLRKRLRVLSVIAAIAPLLGLLGTIFGMIRAFQTVAMSADALGKTERLAEGIYEAMITTAAGLTVAIPVLIAYHIIVARIDRIVQDMDHMTVEFVETYVHGELPGTHPAAEAHESADAPDGAAVATT